jgi:long-chain acyl-CoA synthetase
VTVPRGTALVKLTSGSTGEPLGICLGEEALLVGIRQIAEGMSLCADQRVLVAIPLSHSYGFDNGVLSLAVVGTPLILEPGFYPTRLLQALQEGEATFFPAVPPLVRCLGEVPWPPGLALRRVICAAGPLASEHARRFRERSGRAVHQFYGSTETGGITFERHPEEEAAEGTVGTPLPGVSIQLTGNGQVRVCSGASFGGLLGRDRKLGSRSVLLGDQAEWTADGRLRLTGRAASFLNVGGCKISVQAVESALREVHGVEDAAVVGVADAVRGDRLVAFLVSRNGPPDLSRLPSRIAPREVRLVETLPYTPRGKLDRLRLREMAQEPG